MKDNKPLYALLVFVAGSSYGFIVPMVKVAVEMGMRPADFLPLQYLIALVLCLGVLLVQRVEWGSPRSLAKLAVLGVFTGSTSICYYAAVALLPSAVALTLLFQYVWVSVLLECVIERHLPERSTVVAVVIVLVGTVFAAGVFEEGFTSLDFAGVALGAGSAVFYACYLYFSGRVGVNRPMPVRATMLAAGGLVVTTAVNPLCFTAAFTVADIWPFAVGLAFVGIIIPTTIVNFASPKLSAGMVSVMASSELPVGILSAWALVGDTPTALELVGVVIVLVGIAVKQLPSILNARR